MKSLFILALAPQMEEISDLHWSDYVVFVLFLGCTMGVGVYHGLCAPKTGTTKEFLTANNDLSIWPVALAILSSFLSAILILGTPAEVYEQGTMYWMYVWGMMFSCVLAVLVWVPLLYPLRFTSSYEVSKRGTHCRLVRIFIYGLLKVTKNHLCLMFSNSEVFALKLLKNII